MPQRCHYEITGREGLSPLPDSGIFLPPRHTQSARQSHDFRAGGAPLRTLCPDGPLFTVLDGVTLVGQLGPLGQETLAALLPAALEDPPSGLGRHPGPETVLTLPNTFGGLIGALAHGFRAILGLRTPARGAETSDRPSFVNAPEDFPEPKFRKNPPVRELFQFPGLRATPKYPLRHLRSTW